MKATDLENATRLRASQSGLYLNSYNITVEQFISVLQDMHHQRATTPNFQMPTFSKIISCGIPVRAISDDGIILWSWDDILREYGRQYITHNPFPRGILELAIGPWRYPVPLPPRSFSASSPLHPHNAVHHTEEQSPTATTQKAGEPACLCSSRALVTVGHEQGCRWLLWRRSNG
jgi:hypothetical protein